ncbi:hypothetical protein PoB_005838400 [Plakobranchus ocellatus]|uniref:Uncharacterized protein n=1 Tax=Plakobranchus ocellatus TaxID=259542 RepID=A0AAV4CGJ4_9GAST|nr:hypothetical protein PoB_005838400 [Plakobranchus ocellatus]
MSVPDKVPDDDDDDDDLEEKRNKATQMKLVESSEVNVGTWSPFYCMALWRNFRMILAAVLMATRSPRQRISFAGVSGHPLGWSSATSRHSDKIC